MRKANGPASGGLGQQTTKAVAWSTHENGVMSGGASALSEGGLRLRGMISRRSKRPLRDDLELVTYTVTSRSGTHFAEQFTPPGGPYLTLGEIVDIEVEVNTYTAKTGAVHHRLRVCQRTGDF